MAFTVTKANNVRDVKDDPDFVKWFARQVIMIDGQRSYVEIPMHKCSPYEMSLFYEPR